jgi:acyl-CoA thioesterase
MDNKTRKHFQKKVDEEPFAKAFNIRLADISEGFSKVQMKITKEMGNLFGMTHGGAIFALIDEAFETASNSHGTLAVALNMNVTYLNPPRVGSLLTAEAREINRTRKTATYDIRVFDDAETLIAACQALVYRKGTPLPFSE